MHSGFASERLPSNVQLIARPFDEAALIHDGMLPEAEADGYGARQVPAEL